MKIIKEFREFAVRGSVVDLAVGIIIGGAFQKIVSSLVGDLLTPLLSMLTGGIDFSQRSVTLKALAGAEPVILHYGAFIQNVIDFVIVAFAIFLMVKGINRLRRSQEPEAQPAVPAAEEKLLTEIRDLLKSKN